MIQMVQKLRTKVIVFRYARHRTKPQSLPNRVPSVSLPCPFPMKKPTLSQRLKAKKRSQAMIIALTWYTEETWAQVKATATDPACFEDSFENWKAAAIKAQREFLRSGVRAIECQIVPAEFFSWCEKNQQENNSAARAEYVAETLTTAQAALSAQS